MTELAGSGRQIWITRGHLVTLGFTMCCIAVLSFFVGMRVGRGQAAPELTPTASSYLPDPTDQDALEALLREVERTQAEAAARAPAADDFVFPSALEGELPPPPEAPDHAPAAVLQVAADPDETPSAPEEGASEVPGTAGWTIQVAAFQTPEEADAQVEALQTDGLKPFRTEALVKGETWYRVRVGAFKSREAAEAAAAELKEQLGGLDLMVAHSP